MNKVKTLLPHKNVHGVHKKNEEYAHARPAMDIKFGYVEAVEPTVAELKAEAEERGISLPTKGSGTNGAVVKADVAKAVEDGAAEA